MKQTTREDGTYASGFGEYPESFTGRQFRSDRQEDHITVGVKKIRILFLPLSHYFPLDPRGLGCALGNCFR